MALTAASAYTEHNEAKHPDEIRSYTVILDQTGKAREGNDVEDIEKGETRFTVSFHKDGAVRVAKFRDSQNKFRERFDVTTFRLGDPTRTEHMEYDPNLYSAEVETVRVFDIANHPNIRNIFTYEASIIDGVIEPKMNTEKQISELELSKMLLCERKALDSVLKTMSGEDKANIRAQGGDIPANSRHR